METTSTPTCAPSRAHCRPRSSATASSRSPSRALRAACLAAALALTATPALPGSGGATVDELLSAFVEDLTDLRAGADAAAPGMRQLADRLCEEFQRCDAVAIAEFYAALSAEERRSGLAHEERFEEVYGRVHDAQGLTPHEWELERRAIRADLDALIEAPAPRPTPCPPAAP